MTFYETTKAHKIKQDLYQSSNVVVNLHLGGTNTAQFILLCCLFTARRTRVQVPCQTVKGCVKRTLQLKVDLYNDVIFLKNLTPEPNSGTLAKEGHDP